MPKVGNGKIFFPKGMSRLDRDIVQKIIDIKDCEKKLHEVKAEILNTRTLLLNLQARQENLEDTIRKEQDELNLQWSIDLMNFFLQATMGTCQIIKLLCNTEERK